MKTLLKAVPEIEPHILWEGVIGAQAIESWIGKPGGPLISTVQVPGQVGQDRPAIRSPIPGLYFAGDGAGARGIGTELAAQSAMGVVAVLIGTLAGLAVLHRVSDMRLRQVTVGRLAPRSCAASTIEKSKFCNLPRTTIAT